MTNSNNLVNATYIIHSPYQTKMDMTNMNHVYKPYSMYFVDLYQF